MERPTREQLADAVVILSGAIQDRVQRAAWETFEAEVRALRVDLERQVACCKALQESQSQLAEEGVQRNRLYERQVATIARVDALVEQWRRRDVIGAGWGGISNKCAEELEAAIRGPQ